MKKSKLFFPMVLLAALFLVAACQKDSIAELPNERAERSQVGKVALDQDLAQARSSANRDFREIPFRATFFTRIVEEMLGEVTCEDPSLPNPNYQAGGGNGTHLGNFTTVITFCGGGGGVYGNGTGYLEAANGDRLFICIPAGQVLLLPEPDPVYDAYFQDPFEFCGGTGRFEGASGGGMTNSLVDLWNEEFPFPGPAMPGHRTDHEFTGTLILPNGN